MKEKYIAYPKNIIETALTVLNQVTVQGFENMEKIIIVQKVLSRGKEIEIDAEETEKEERDHGSEHC